MKCSQNLLSNSTRAPTPWNQFDFVLVMAGYSGFLPVGDSGTGGLKALRALRALRPLRTITRFEVVPGR